MMTQQVHKKGGEHREGDLMTNAEKLADIRERVRQLEDRMAEHRDAITELKIMMRMGWKVGAAVAAAVGVIGGAVAQVFIERVIQ